MHSLLSFPWTITLSAAPSVTGTAFTGSGRALVVYAAPSVNGTAFTGSGRALVAYAAPSVTGTAFTGSGQACVILDAPLVTGEALKLRALSVKVIYTSRLRSPEQLLWALVYCGKYLWVQVIYL